MRLTHLKLAGFKSFVDPTTLHIHGQRVGVVGPNGCGKSNVMESVRWVLGESSAKEMRGDSMDDVIFNGSGNRKPISRASVELVFDNSLGGASGEWSQYAEISVKRVIERDKGSTYYINNTVVRRRDVADLFLGTGLGGRAYAIIGQNTINRIVEAKPEELRIFLEEAAGISKYKERRRETESRLRDTRENLTRVEDILRELDKQILHLQSQAVVAEQYHRLQDALNITKGQVWLLKKRDASAQWEKAQRHVEKLVNELEAQMASLRNNESALELARQQNFNAAETVNQAQTKYYEVNAEVSNLENQVKNTAEARERMQLQLQQLTAQLDKNIAQHDHFQDSLLSAQHEIQAANTDFSAAEQVIKMARDAVPILSNQYQLALAAFNVSQSALIHAEQRLRLEQANIGHITRTVTETNEHLLRLQQSLTHLQFPSDEALAEKEAQLALAEAEITSIEKHVSELLQNEHSINLALKEGRDLHGTNQRALNLLEAEIGSLMKIQQAMQNGNNEVALSKWLKTAGLNNSARIWQKISIKSGWETAFESALGARLNAFATYEMAKADRPPSALSLAFTTNPVVTNKISAKTEQSPLYSLVEKIEPNLQAVLQDWLANAYFLEDGVDAIAASKSLASGEYLVNRQGDIYTKQSVSYFGAQSLLHGVLERQAQLDKLQIKLPDLQKSLAQTNQHVIKLEQKLHSLRAEHQTRNQQLKTATQQAHQFNLALQQLKQQQSNALQRQKVLQADIALADEKRLKLIAESALKAQLIKEISQSLDHLQSEKTVANEYKITAETAFNEARNQLQTLERAHQEKTFNIRLNNNNIKELSNKINSLLEENTSLKLRCNEVEATLSATKMEALKTNLENALNHKQQHELALASARNQMSETETALQQQERSRMQNEQLLHPLRDKLEASRLVEQESRLYFEHCQAELTASNISELHLAEHLEALMANGNEDKLKVPYFERKRDNLAIEIEALGAVNLAAIHELDTEQTRKHYLDSQCKDLREASETLEDAIRKIDRETRGRLQATFDEANRHFSELFSTLFGGGQARLELLGEEILDTGMLVFAQPPGKKNSTIHLLSGGEKALTALALVFALFRLNPAPFCLMDEVDAPLDDSNTERFCSMVKKMSEKTQFLYVSHNKITMEMAQQLIGVTMQESGVSRIVDVDMEAAVRMIDEVTA
ncbi:chromosome segregation protein SMC [Methylotenera sp.]|uniref:chromosome segregation protein SMC n=1 Tax=Methylotenera sp. TaxID=2051956 RepID=UPI00273004DF|nr:chromosome segregation protein SMC [Methylotenera sp.]MDP2071578.1 chromosome segregation protein SMC [Methylotenera sp.]MDP2231759.1 chromosome segregation protein SMC [Methylotenera sp.]MDP3006668.1 chromosome segregation protein SMC [Methylotenera sp.]